MSETKKYYNFLNACLVKENIVLTSNDITHNIVMENSVWYVPFLQENKSYSQKYKVKSIINTKPTLLMLEEDIGKHFGYYGFGVLDDTPIEEIKIVGWG